MDVTLYTLLRSYLRVVNKHPFYQETHYLNTVLTIYLNYADINNLKYLKVIQKKIRMKKEYMR
jgi:hypothetical protein